MLHIVDELCVIPLLFFFPNITELLHCFFFGSGIAVLPLRKIQLLSANLEYGDMAKLCHIRVEHC